MLTPSQLRAARALIGLPVNEASGLSGLSAEVIVQAESDGAHVAPDVMDRLQTLLESKGVMFLGAGEGDAGAGPGVRLRQGSHDEGIRPENLNSFNDG
jgi:hypothetical protein